METMQQVSYPTRDIRPYLDIEDAQVIEEHLIPQEIKPRQQFIESNTKEVSLHHLRKECVIPVFSKDNEVTISHNNFIDTMQDAIYKVFPNERIAPPEIRVSHLIKGRTPDAIHKKIEDLTDKDKTLYYERMAFVIEIPSITDNINGNDLCLTVGGVRAYNHENLFSKKAAEKFKIFIGFKNMVCCNLCVTTDGYKGEVKASSCDELLKAIQGMIMKYNAANHIKLMHQLKYYGMTEHQFAQLIGKSRLYQYLSRSQKNNIPLLEFNDSHINIIARNYYKDKNFSRGKEGCINLWNVYNLFTEANKNSYIDTFLDRSTNATTFMTGIAEALGGSKEYRWFID
jgi:hypothetical protein